MNTHKKFANTFFSVKSINSLASAAYAVNKARRAKAGNSRSLKTNLADEVLEAQALLVGPKKNKHVRISMTNDITTLPNIILYSDLVMDFIRTHCGTKSQQQVVLQVVSSFTYYSFDNF